MISEIWIQGAILGQKLAKLAIVHWTTRVQVATENKKAALFEIHSGVLFRLEDSLPQIYWTIALKKICLYVWQATHTEKNYIF